MIKWIFNIFLSHPNEQQVMYALIEEEIIAAIRQDDHEDDSTEIQKVSCLKL